MTTHIRETRATTISSDPPSPVAYVMSRFPKLTETFILEEIVAMRSAGVPIEIYPLLRQSEAIAHRNAIRLAAQAHYLPFVSREILGSQLHYLVRQPRVYLGALAAVLRGTWRSRNHLMGAIAIFPKVVHVGRLMKMRGIRHVHCHFATHPALAGFVIRRMTGIPYSFTAHGSDLHVDRRMLCEKLGEASFAVAISGHNREVMLQECPSAGEKVQVIHCGVDTSFFSPKPAERTETFTVASVGTLHEVKGHRYLVAACRELLDGGIEFKCVIVGDGPDRQMLEALIVKSGLDGRVSLVGALDRDAVRDTVGRADALVAPSVPTRRGQREGIPVVLMEAMSLGLPVVASDISGIPELVDDRVTGLLVPPRDHHALAEAIASLARDPARRRELGHAGRQKILREFDARVNAATLARHFAQGQS